MIKFQKFQGTGNDFIIVGADDLHQINHSTLAKQICHRTLGIGADGLIIVDKSEVADCKMIFFNADGSEATMCGNGIRCFAKYIYDQDILNKTLFTVETLAGVMTVRIVSSGTVESLVEVNLGYPKFDHKTIPKVETSSYYLNQPVLIEDETYSLSSIVIGTIHTVVFVEQLDEDLAKKVGPLIENHSLFPFKTNVNFCKVIDSNTLSILTWEKGAGLTLACGTGACACSILSQLLNETSTNVDVKVLGGTLNIELSECGCLMTGPATFIASGEYVY